MIHKGSVTNARSSARAGNAENPISKTHRRPHRFAARPAYGASKATSNCGSRMQAAMIRLAFWSERLVISTAANGNIAALARWNSSVQAT